MDPLMSFTDFFDEKCKRNEDIPPEQPLSSTKSTSVAGRTTPSAVLMKADGLSFGVYALIGVVIALIIILVIILVFLKRHKIRDCLRGGSSGSYQPTPNPDAGWSCYFLILVEFWLLIVSMMPRCQISLKGSCLNVPQVCR